MIAFDAKSFASKTLFINKKGSEGMNEPLIYNIQKYSAHDGQGIRTTVFFKGCPMRCKWCDKIESQSYHREILFNREKCVECGTCVEYCQNDAISNKNGIEIEYNKCTGCGICTEYCYQAARVLSGKSYPIEELVNKLANDALFYEDKNGGVTLAGGEVMTQNIQYIEELVQTLHTRGFNIQINTSGYCVYENFRRIHRYVDTFVYELKMIDQQKHIKYTGVENTLILENLIRLSRAGIRVKLRIPLVAGINDTEHDILQLIKFLKKYEITYQRLYLVLDSNKRSRTANINRIISLFKENGITTLTLEQ